MVGGNMPGPAMKLTPKQAAAHAVVSLSLVYQWCQDGVLVHYRLGRQGKRGRIRIEEADLVAFLETCRKEADAPGPIRLKHIQLR